MARAMKSQSGSKRRMEALEVFVNEDLEVVIKTDDYGDGGSVVAIPAEQIDVVVKWMQECRDEAKTALQERQA